MPRQRSEGQWWWRGGAAWARRALARLFEADASRPAPSCRPRLEMLEDRDAPAGWQALGPITQFNDPERIKTEDGALGPDGAPDKRVGDVAGNVSGMATALAFCPDITKGQQGRPEEGQPGLFLGSASGGLWYAAAEVKTGEVSNAPTWVQCAAPTTGPGGQPIADLSLFPGVNRIGCLAVAPDAAAATAVIYAGTGEANDHGEAYAGAGVLKSVDGGKTWQLVSTQFAGYSVARIIVDPTNSEKVWAAVVPGIGPKYADTALTGVYSNEHGGAGQ